MIGRLLSVNVGGPREVEWEGKTVRTGDLEGAGRRGRAWCGGSTSTATTRPTGSAHGGEHRAVFVYQIESYRYWERELGRDDFSYGQFGENFTVEGLADDEVCIGDRYRIGDAVFEVTQPRVTCYRVGIRMDEPRMPSLLVAHHRPGLLPARARGGRGAGRRRDRQGRRRARAADRRARSTRCSTSPTSRARCSSGRCGCRRSARAGRGASASCSPRPSGDAAAGAARGPGSSRYASPRSAARARPSPRSGSCRRDGAPSGPSAQAGQYLTVRLQPDVDGPPLIRSYSLSDLPDERGYRISVKREGRRKPLPARAREGRRSASTPPPRAAASSCATATRPVVLISAGVGATPVLAMLHALAGEHTTQAGLVGARCAQPRRARLRRGGRRAARRARERPPARGLQPAGARGGARLRLRRRGPTRSRGPRTRRASPRTPITTSADPTEFMRAIGAALTARGVAPEQRRQRGLRRRRRARLRPREGRRPSAAHSRWPTRHRPDRDLRRAATSPSPGTIGTRACSTSPRPATCPSDSAAAIGVCHNCESGVVAGAVTYTQDPLEPPPDGRVLVCCSQPASELALDL